MENALSTMSIQVRLSQIRLCRSAMLCAFALLFACSVQCACAASAIKSDGAYILGDNSYSFTQYLQRTNWHHYRRTRTYYIGIDRVVWDYYPVHANNRSLNAGANGDRCTNAKFAADQLLFVGDGTNATGFIATSAYEKVVFREYTDATFGKLKPRRKEEQHLALLGPLLRVAAGERLKVVIRGLRESDVQKKEVNSFAFEIDGLHSRWKYGLIAPGRVVTQIYDVDESHVSPNKSYVASKMLLYRGVAGISPDGNAGVYKGLLGSAVVYRRGELKWNGMPKKDFTELVTILWVGNENKGGEEGDKEESNLMHSINGRVYCSLSGLDLHKGKRAVWYFGAVGNEVDVHTAHIHGVVGYDEGGIRTDSIRLVPGVTSAVELMPDNPGIWLYHCHINDHLHAGMVVLFTVHDSNRKRSKSESLVSKNARVREYFIQAEDVEWDYAPKGRNICDNRNFNDDEKIFVDKSFPISLKPNITGYGIGAKYIKSRYFEYTDNTFSKRIKRSDSMQHLGVMGPVLRARVGEVIKIHFRNKCKDPVSMHPHGVWYDKANEGAPYNDGTEGKEKMDDAVQPGETYTYRWIVPERAGPGPGERQDAKLWIYHSHRNEISDTYAGLFGVIVVIGKTGVFDENTLLPKDGSNEIFVHMTVMDEGGSFHLSENAKRIRGNRALSTAQFEELLENDQFKESNLMHSINGYLYCNGPVIKLKQGQPTRFYFYALGTEVDLHTPQIGNEAMKLDVMATRGSGTLLAGTFSSAIVTPRHAGFQELRCNVNDHVVAGMRAKYFVQADPKKASPTTTVSVTHYIAAEEIEWNYTPLGRDGCPSKPFGEDEKVFTKPGNETSGSRYVKALYREYRDAKFKQRKQRKGKSFSGVVGPLLHFEVGEIVSIVFRNRLSFAANLNLVGLELISSSSPPGEVQPGSQVTYIYRVHKGSGPSASDPSAIPFVYYSSVDPIAHTAAGLVGVFAVVRKGWLRKHTRLPRDRWQVYPLLLNIFRENESPLIRKSLNRYALRPKDITDARLKELQENDEWLESNAMHSINGYLYGNNPILHSWSWTTVRFYAFGFGSEASMHSPVFKGQVIAKYIRSGNSAAGTQILPFNAETVDVNMRTKGTWPIVCGTADHVLGGMKACVKIS